MDATQATRWLLGHHPAAYARIVRTWAAAGAECTDPEVQAQAIAAYLQARLDAGLIIRDHMTRGTSDGLFDGDQIGR